MNHPSLFDPLAVPTREIAGLVHRDDGWESQVAALRAKPKMAPLRQRIISAIVFYGPKTAKELEVMPEFRGDGDYAVRRRCSDLRVAGRLVQVGTRENAAVLDLPKEGA